MDQIKLNKVVLMIFLAGGILLLLVGLFATPNLLTVFVGGLLEKTTVIRIEMIRPSLTVSGLVAILFGLSFQGSRLKDASERHKTPKSSSALQVIQERRTYLAFCILLFLLVLAIGLAMTPSGPGITPDSTGYISAAENIHSGLGLYIGYFGGYVPYASWPPLYPLMIAALMKLGFAAEQAANWVVLLGFSALMVVIFFLGKEVCSVYTGYISALTCLILTPVLQIASNAWSEIPYLLFSALALLYLVKFLKEKDEGFQLLYIAAIFSSLAALTRYIGLVLALVGIAAVLIKYNFKGWSIPHAALFLVISVLPTLAWFYRNLVLTGYLSGQARGASDVNLLINLGRVIYVVLSNFMVEMPIIALTVLLFISMAIYKREVLFEILFHPSKYLKLNYIIIFYISLYILALMALSTLWSFDPIDTRLTSPTYPFLVILVVSANSYAYKRILALNRRTICLIMVLCILIFILQSYISFNFYQFSRIGQGYNSPFWRNSEGLPWLESNLPEDARLYTNDIYAIRHWLKRSSLPLPQSNDPSGINAWLNEISGLDNAYIVIFKIQTARISNEDLIRLNQKHGLFEAAADFPEFTLYVKKGVLS